MDRVWFLMQMEPTQKLVYGNEVRFCFESINIGQDGQREIHSAVFYGDVTKRQFTAVGIPKVDNPVDSHEYWLCSKPKNDPDIVIFDLDNPFFNVTGHNYIDKEYNYAQV